MDSQNWAYAAGVIDGEGCIHAAATNTARGRATYVVRLTVTNTCPELVKWFQEQLGGTIWTYTNPNERYRVRYVWHAPAKDVKNILLGVLPYLKVKAELAKLGIEMREAIEARKVTRQGLPMAEKARRLVLCEKIRHLNHPLLAPAETKPEDSDFVAEAIVRAQAN
jgi:hypothetical protein